MLVDRTVRRTSPSGVRQSIADPAEVPLRLGEVLAGALHAGALGLIAMNFVAASRYGALLSAFWDGHTVGMRLFKLRCVDATTQAPVTAQQAFIRSLTAQAFVVLEVFGFFGSLVEVADLLRPLWDKRNQTLHDKVGKTVVLGDLDSTK